MRGQTLMLLYSLAPYPDALFIIRLKFLTTKINIFIRRFMKRKTNEEWPYILISSLKVGWIGQKTISGYCF